MSLQRRLASNITRVISCNFRNIRSRNDSLEIIYENDGKQEKLIMPFVWLRDHCSSSKYFHAPTNQRKSNCVELLSRAKVNGEEQVTLNEQDALCIDWNDGHRSEFEIRDLLSRALRKKSPSLESVISPWNSELKHIPRISNSSLELKTFSEHLVRYGVVVIEGVEGSAEATEKLCQSLIPVHDTFFGQFWVFSNSASEDEPSYEDTAYGNEDIGPHTDGTYFNQAPGIQVFHCLQPAKTGGDTVLVDAFFCAQKLRSEDPEAFETLCKTKIAHHYLEGSPPGSSIHSVSLEKQVIETDSSGNVTQVRLTHTTVPLSTVSPLPILQLLTPSGSTKHIKSSLSCAMSPSMQSKSLCGLDP
ncbi:unnamed protein product [Caenorhabditis sp. 36 PRJEB53466]|nr:unnamed protein product [Caenorhabditis sp. 36 PRJEB53466]